MQPRRHEGTKEDTKKNRTFSRGVRVFVMLSVVVAVGLAAVTPLRHAVLRGVGRALVSADEEADVARGFSRASPADLLAMDVESEEAGILKLSDLYHAQTSGTVGVLRKESTAVDSELARRGVVLPDLVLEVLRQLGIPKTAIVQIPAGEGGTTETTAALAGWARAHPGKRVLVVVGPSHGRRYRRALRRAWPDGQPPPAVVTTSYGLFRAEDWWQSRTTLREGLVELEKLALDYVAHPAS